MVFAVVGIGCESRRPDGGLLGGHLDDALGLQRHVPIGGYRAGGGVDVDVVFGDADAVKGVDLVGGVLFGGGDPTASDSMEIPVRTGTSAPPDLTWRNRAQ